MKLKAQKVEGIILDLRNNGGGSLTEVGDIMGLFMNGGAYVQVKNGDGKIQTLRDKSTSPLWTGPLVIMQNELSASASEILAGAMQDYGRAVIVGSPQSYGKGTVQTFVDLNRFLNTNDDFGSLKLTIQKFYRITGESTQIKGVNSDISLKDFFTNSEIGERFGDYALPWDKIAATDFKKMNIFNVAALEKASQERVKNNANYQLLQKSTEWKDKLDKEKSITLNEKKFMALMDKRKADLKEFKPLEKYDNKLSFILNPDEVLKEKSDTTFAKKTKSWTKNLSRDFYLDEAVNIVSEMK
ncbi:carboxy terminal-processing peptidase [Halpernia sp. GG3]